MFLCYDSPQYGKWLDISTLNTEAQYHISWKRHPISVTTPPYGTHYVGEQPQV